ncbi:MAG: GNAT family N-acetyltransferase [Cyanosarcina radialis HA8281-LM2]|jgi:GNAT superfamily N-acetyltransferase|nr:GNAT family N-acetyltransferase [Cyanosarcina radialis HA8281-LM2]
MNVCLAQIEHIEDLSKLFDRYRVFYNQTSDLASAKQFISDRCKNGDSAIFVAEDNQVMAGFTQLYPSFSSVSMKRVWILNDLFVAEAYRRQGVARLLMDAAEKYALETGAVRMVLATQIANTVAQKLYESRNYVKDEAFYHYTLGLG